LTTVFIGFFTLPFPSPAEGAASNERVAIVIAHRGASGLRPEHTLGAYELALEQGADFIELDLVPTRDGVLIARHENALAMVALDDEGAILREPGGTFRLIMQTTNVAEQEKFADRLTVKTVDDRRIGGWFSEDFTLEEIESLRARERIPDLRPQNRLYDDQFTVPTLEGVIDFVERWEQRTGQRPGLYLEIKHPTYFLHEGRYVDGAPIGIDLGASLLGTLQARGFVAADRVFIQAFEVAPLITMKEEMRSKGMDLPLIQLFGDVTNQRFRAAPRDLVFNAGRGATEIYGELEALIEGGINPSISYAELATPAVLAYMARRYATGIGPTRNNILPNEASGGEFGPLLADALNAGLVVHPYTLRAERVFLIEYQGRLLSVVEEARLMLKGGVDGFFIDQPAEGRKAVDGFHPQVDGFQP